MRDLFIVGAKLMGIYFLLTDFIGVMQYTMSAVVFSHQTNDSTIDILGITTLYLFGIPFVIHVAAGLMLVFRTTWLAKIVGIPDTPLPKIDPKIILQIGIVLLGIYTILLGIPSVLRYCIQLMQLNAHGGYSPIVHLDWQTILPNISRVVFGGLLVFASHPFSKMILRSLKTPSEGV